MNPSSPQDQKGPISTTTTTTTSTTLLSQPPTLSDLADVVDRIAPLPLSTGQQKMAKSDLLYTEPDHHDLRENETKLDSTAQTMISLTIPPTALTDITPENLKPEAAHNDISPDSNHSNTLLPENEKTKVNEEADSAPLDEPLSLEDTATLSTTAASSQVDASMAASADFQSTEHNAPNSPQSTQQDVSNPPQMTKEVAANSSQIGANGVEGGSAPNIEVVNPADETPAAKRQRTQYELTPDTPRSTAMSREQRKYCSAIIRNMKRLKEARLFLEPVDPVKFNIPDYFDIIKRPMDLSTVEKTLAAQQYHSVEEFSDDVRLIFQNCYRYNGKESLISASAKSLESRFETQMKKLPPLVEIDVTAALASHSAPGSASAFSTPAPPYSLGGPRSAKSASSANSTHGFSTPSTPAISARPRRETHPPPHHNLPLTSPSHSHHPINDPQLRFCHQVLREFTKKAHSAYAFAFLQPVDHVALNIPDYPRIIKRPMDISTIRRKLESGEYSSHIEFEADVILMFNNCYTYNAPGTLVYNWGKQLEMVFRNKWRDLPPPAPPKSVKTPRVRGSATKATAKRPREHEDEDLELSEESEDEHATQLAELEKHLLVMSQQLATMKSKKSKADKKRKRALSPTASAPAGMSKAKGIASQGKRGSVGTGGAKRAPRKRKPKAKGDGVGTEGSGRAKSATGAYGSQHIEEEEDIGNHTYTHNAPSMTTTARRGSNTITDEEKIELSNLITDLPESKLATVVDIIRESMPEIRDFGEEIELDIDSLSPTTLTKLYRFVSGKAPGGNRGGGRGSARGRGRGRGRGGAAGGAGGEGEKEKDRKGKMTYLTEEEQSRKINELEMKLKQFAEVNGVAVPDAGTGQGGSSSDSSSSGSEDSDSGEESSESLI